MKGNVLICQLLLNHGADINAKTATNGNTPLMIAVLDNHTLIVDTLLSRNCNLDIRNRANGETALMIGLQRNLIGMVRKLLEKKANPNLANANGDTCLHLAARMGSTGLVEILIEMGGANLRAKNSQNLIPLQVTTDLATRRLLEDYDPGIKSHRWQIDLSDLEGFNEKKLIGSGNFSKCYRASLNGTPVAVKVLTVQDWQKQKKALEYEVGIMWYGCLSTNIHPFSSDIKHPNIVLLLGACSTQDNLCIVMEFFPRGDLRKAVQDYTFFNWEKLVRFSTDVARGLNWLHTRKPPVLHKDLHTRNILVSLYGEACKIADMGTFGPSSFQLDKVYRPSSDNSRRTINCTSASVLPRSKNLDFPRNPTYLCWASSF